MMYFGYTTALRYWRSQRLTGQRPAALGTRRLIDVPHSAEETRGIVLPSSVARERAPHAIVAEGTRRHVPGAFTYHVCGKTFPDGSFVQISDTVAIASPELLYLQMAEKLPTMRLIELGMELCGTYGLQEEGGCFTRRQPLTDKRRIGRLLDQAEGMRGHRSATRTLKYLAENSASPRETAVDMLLCLPLHMGGLGIRPATMNYRVDFDDDARTIVARSFARCDLCWPDVRLDVEIDSREFHSRARDISRDKARANALGHQGFRVINITYEQLMDVGCFFSIAKDICTATKSRPRKATHEKQAQQQALYFELIHGKRCPTQLGSF